MPKEKRCVDVYGEKLNIGDAVIPVISEACVIGIGGIISDIHYSEQYQNHYINISNKEGKVLLSGVGARCYTTKERFNDREDGKNIYSLTFYDDRCWPLTRLPLTNRTDPDYEFPEGTNFISLSYNRMCSDVSYISGDEYFFATKDKVKFGYSREYREHYLEVFETRKCRWEISKNHKYFNSDEQLKDYIKSLIQYFNNADLTHVNNDTVFSENPVAEQFEKTLILFLKSHKLK